MRIYYIYRAKRGKQEYYCRDTARTFWLRTMDPKWIKFFLDQSEALDERDKVRCEYLGTYYYGVISTDWSTEEIQRYTHPPLDGTPLI